MGLDPCSVVGLARFWVEVALLLFSFKYAFQKSVFSPLLCLFPSLFLYF
jgi:hypothetical protein